jgi:hypothetical protein
MTHAYKNVGAVPLLSLESDSDNQISFAKKGIVQRMEGICIFKASPYVSKESMKKLMEANVIVIIDGSQYSTGNLSSSIIFVPPRYMTKLHFIEPLERILDF